MSSRKLLVCGNWKSNNSLSQTKDLVNNVLNKIAFVTSIVDVIVAPISLQIPYVLDHVQSNIKVAIQNASATRTGAYSGEISPLQIYDFGIEWVILGQSERRQSYGETNDIVAEKVKLSIQYNLKVIVCVSGELKEVQNQLDAIKDWRNIVIAFEPSWDENDKSAQAQQSHLYIRKYLEYNVSKDVSKSTRIIYGGNINKFNMETLIEQPDIDGFLVNKLSLKPLFAEVVKTCSRHK